MYTKLLRPDPQGAGLAAVARLHKALSDSTRLRILNLLLAYEELCVCDVEVILELTQSRASRQLKELRQAGLVSDRREGTWAYYRIPEPAMPLLVPLSAPLQGDPVAQGDLRRAKAYRRDPCCDAPTRLTRRPKVKTSLA